MIDTIQPLLAIAGFSLSSLLWYVYKSKPYTIICIGEKILIGAIAVSASFIEVAKKGEGYTSSDLPWAVFNSTPLRVLCVGICVYIAVRLLCAYLDLKTINWLIKVAGLGALLVCFLPSLDGYPAYFQGQVRFEGVFGNPNTYALASVVGIFLSMSVWGERIGIGRAKKNGDYYLYCSIVLVSILLLKSHSRGAWVALATAVIYGVTMNETADVVRDKICYICGKWKTIWGKLLIGILLGAAIASGWAYRLFARMLSVLNIDDFSWANRARAWDGCFAMLMDRPLNGFGWSEAASYYNGFYLPRSLVDWEAWDLNSYLFLGVVGGAILPYILICSVLRSLIRSNDMIGQRLVSSSLRLALCAISVGVLFNGGLMEWYLSIIFWVLLALTERLNIERPRFRWHAPVTIEASSLRTSGRFPATHTAHVNWRANMNCFRKYRRAWSWLALWLCGIGLAFYCKRMGSYDRVFLNVKNDEGFQTELLSIKRRNLPVRGTVFYLSTTRSLDEIGFDTRPIIDAGYQVVIVLNNRESPETVSWIVEELVLKTNKVVRGPARAILMVDDKTRRCEQILGTLKKGLELAGIIYIRGNYVYSSKDNNEYLMQTSYKIIVMEPGFAELNDLNDYADYSCYGNVCVLRLARFGEDLGSARAVAIRSGCEALYPN